MVGKWVLLVVRLSFGVCFLPRHVSASDEARVRPVGRGQKLLAMMAGIIRTELLWKDKRFQSIQLIVAMATIIVGCLAVLTINWAKKGSSLVARPRS